MPKVGTRSTGRRKRVIARRGRAGRNSSPSKTKNITSRKRALEHPRVVQGGKVAYVLVPIEDYERMIESEMIDTAIRRLDDPDDQWVDAGQFALELAGQRIAQARKAAGLTQKQLGDKLKLPQSQISRIERNPDHTTVRTLKRIARALGVDISALI